jgi:MFS transporter, MCT family, solute carrier family 16 (monocarboxylic acid transporters), member 10
MLYNPCLSYVSEWFVVRRGLAIGVISTGTATGGLLLPLILPRLIDKYGPSATLRILSLVLMVLLLPALPFLRGRLPMARVHGPTVRSASTGREWMKSRNWNLFIIASTLQAFGNYSLATLPKLNHYRLLRPCRVAP